MHFTSVASTTDIQMIVVLGLYPYNPTHGIAIDRKSVQI